MRQWVITVVVSAFLSVFSVLVYDRYFATKIVAVDVRGFMEEQKKLYLSGVIGDERLKEEIEKLEKAISGVPSNKVVLMGEVVVRNAESLVP
ncbi:hypothetical protein [Candidatus Manganitrophus noduliformans]|uniref:Uncharacterized protein n=1 Tax=Candidatus Manganitrophus noduliformans TaxID=2606439 RepID=A0A7X6DQ85_9BACT|nr:hypothetical protein [Candidatus Manganitrophus noduliformans]NKE71272.1 hypothetical protein [Candidatus Manganitrophus noduliformans]